MTTIAMLFFVFVNLMLHLVQSFVKGHFGIFTFDMSDNGVIAVDLDQQFHVDSRPFKFDGHINFTHCVEKPNEFLAF